MFILYTRFHEQFSLYINKLLIILIDEKHKEKIKLTNYIVGICGLNSVRVYICIRQFFIYLFTLNAMDCSYFMR